MVIAKDPVKGVAGVPHRIWAPAPLTSMVCARSVMRGIGPVSLPHKSTPCTMRTKCMGKKHLLVECFQIVNLIASREPRLPASLPCPVTRLRSPLVTWMINLSTVIFTSAVMRTVMPAGIVTLEPAPGGLLLKPGLAQVAPTFQAPLVVAVNFANRAAGTAAGKVAGDQQACSRLCMWDTCGLPEALFEQGHRNRACP